MKNKTWTKLLAALLVLSCLGNLALLWTTMKTGEGVKACTSKLGELTEDNCLKSSDECVEHRQDIEGTLAAIEGNSFKEELFDGVSLGFG